MRAGPKGIGDMAPARDGIMGGRTASTVAVSVYALMGAVTLIYQVAWTRQLIGMVGSAMGAISVMLALLMGGLAVGAWLGAGSAQTAERPARRLGTLCLLTSVAGLLTIPLDRVLAISALDRLIPALDPNPAAVLSLCLAIPVMMVPAGLIGAAFPLATRLATADLILSVGVGRVLVAQTAGSVVGAVLAGFLLLPGLGVDATIAVGAVLIAVAGVPLVLRDIPVPAAAAEKGTRRPGSPLQRTAHIVLALSGAATLVYEVAWTRELLLVFGSSVYATAMMLAAVLLGLGLGQWRGSRLRFGKADGLRTLSRAMFGAATAGLLSVVLVRFVPLAYTYAYSSLAGSLAVTAAIQVALCFVVVAVPAFLVGLASPILVRFAVSSPETKEADVGRAYAVNTAAAVVGSLVAGFVLLPLVTAKGAAGAAAALQLCAAALLFRDARRQGASEPRIAWGAVALSAAIAAFVLVNAANPLLNMTLTRTEKQDAAQAIQALRGLEAVYFRDTSQGRVAVYRTPDGSHILRGSGMIEGAQNFIDAQTTELLVRIPAAAASAASRYLVIGLGTGSTSATALRVPGVEKVDTVELNPAVVGASRFFVQDAVTADPRSDIFITDARAYVAAVETTYHVIVSEPSYPLSPFSAQLFTREFFELERARLAPGGVAVQWLPAYLLNEEDVFMMLKTFASVFPDSYVWGTGSDQGGMVDLVVVGVNGSGTIDPATVQARVESGGGGEFEFRQLLGPADLQRFLDDPSIPVNTDDRPLLEYRTPLRQIESLWKH